MTSSFLAYAGEGSDVPTPPVVYVYLVTDFIYQDSSSMIAGFLSEPEAREYADTEPLFSDFRMIDRIPVNMHYRPSEPKATNDLYPESINYRRDRS